MDEKKIIEHEVRLKRTEEDIKILGDSVQEIKEKQARLESVQMVSLEKLSRIEELTKETYNKLAEQEEKELNVFDKYKFWIVTGLIGGIVAIALNR